MFTLRNSMPQLFSQFKQTEVLFSVFQHTAHSSSSKAGTCLSRVQVSKRAQLFEHFRSCLFYVSERHDGIFPLSF